MEQNQVIDTTIPLWGVLTLVISSLGAAIWNAIKLYFRTKEMQTKMKEQDTTMTSLQTRIEVIKTEMHSELEKHKRDTDKEFQRLNIKLDNQGTTLTEVKTMVKLLIENKIKD